MYTQVLPMYDVYLLDWNRSRRSLLQNEKYLLDLILI